MISRTLRFEGIDRRLFFNLMAILVFPGMPEDIYIGRSGNAAKSVSFYGDGIPRQETGLAKTMALSGRRHQGGGGYGVAGAMEPMGSNGTTQPGREMSRECSIPG